ncbi:hypothetical protein C3007_00935 [Avibacterium gallinarum]|uniref:Transmembrane protein n=2 Tax=Avibacterium TaxID=292486 RepID=A0A379AV46_AVIGA|nr:hypothetical protein [Avibacterium gallinarum]POY45319.1 hypothetical protein C3007_00935 [Avibacterium gallinarum]TDP27655.1 hypothetical protein EV689_11030 [Avibacterium gallinarum]SUB26119.1 Uncharacterised protein [Avibacterium gallinarum]
MSSAAHHNETSTRRKEVRYIFLPGEPVEKLARSCDYTILLGTVQEVVFNFQTKLFTDLTVEILPSEKDSNNFRLNAVYDKQTKKLIHGNFSISNQGIPYRVQVSRFFDGTFIVRSKDKELGRYKTTRIGIQTEEIEKPDLWLEPMYIGFSDVPDINQLHGIHKAHQQSAYKWVKTLDQFNHQEVFKPLYQPERVLQAFDELWKDNGYACIKNEPEEVGVVALFKVKKESNLSKIPLQYYPFGTPVERYKTAQTVEVRELEHILEDKEYKELIEILQYYSNDDMTLVKDTIDYTLENKHWIKAINHKVEVKWINGYLAIVFKGKTPAFGFRYAGLAHEKLKGITGGLHISKNIKRVWLSAKEVLSIKSLAKTNFSGPLAVTGFVIDVILDYDTVMLDESGSRDIVELLGRIGLSFLGGMATVSIRSILTPLLIAVIRTPHAAIVFLIGGAVIVITGYFINKSVNHIKEKIWE